MKIYLSKSNNLNPDYIKLIRNFLKTSIPNCSIFEYSGDKDLKKRMILEADIMIVYSSNNLEINDSLNSITIGRGIKSEMKEFLKNHHSDQIVIINHRESSPANNIFLTRNFEFFEDFDDEDDWKNYDEMIVSPENTPILYKPIFKNKGISERILSFSQKQNYLEKLKEPSNKKILLLCK
jgi:hypothetical protein